MAAQSKIQNLLNLKPGEGKIIALPVLYSFFSGAALAFFVTASTSLFLSEFEREILPLSFIASGLLTLLAGRIFGKFGRSLPFTKFIGIGIGFLLVSVLALLGLNRIFGAAFLIFIIYAWIRIFAYLHAVTFWSLAGRLLSLQQAKRLFPLITGGEVFGSLLSFFSVPALLAFISTEDVLLISGASLTAGFFILLLILRKNKVKLSQVRQAPKPSKHEKHEQKNKKGKSFIFLKNNYYKLFFLIAFLPILAQFFVDFIFQIQAKAEFPEKEMLTKFIGYFFGGSSLIEFVLKTFFAGRIMTKYGIKTGLSVLPAVLLISIGAAAVFGFFGGESALFFAFIVLARMFVRVVRTAFNDPATQILYQPLPEEERLIFQNKVESGPKAYATLFAGVLLYIFAQIEALTLVSFAFFLLIILVIWMRTALKIYAEYKIVTQSMLESGELGKTGNKYRDIAIHLNNEINKMEARLAKPLKYLGKIAFPSYFKEEGNISAHKLNQLTELAEKGEIKERKKAIEVLGNYKIYKIEKLFKRLLYDTDYEIRNKSISVAGQLKEPEFFPHLFRNFQNKKYRQASIQAMIDSGERIIPYLNKFFPKNENDTDAQLKLLSVYKFTGGDNSVNFLRTYIKHPNRKIRTKIYEVLGHLSYTANYSESLVLSEELGQNLRNIIYLSQIIDEFETESGYRNDMLTAVLNEKKKQENALYAVLTVLYDTAAIELIRRNLHKKAKTAKAAGEAAAFALEIADFVLSEAHKELLLPFFNSEEPADTVRAYRNYFPVKAMKRPDRLSDISLADVSVVGTFLKAVALEELSGYKDEKTLRTLKSEAVNSDPMLSEQACMSMYRINPAVFEDFINKNAYRYPALAEISKKIRLKSESSDLLIFEKLRLLSGLDLFKGISAESLERVSQACKELSLKPGESKWLNKEDVWFVVTGIIKSEQQIFTDGALISSANFKLKAVELKADESCFCLKTHISLLADSLASNPFFADKLLNYYKKQPTSKNESEQ